MWNAVERDRLIALMDKLAAVQMDLKPWCERDGLPTAAIPPKATIDEACSILRAATYDLRQVIRSLDGPPEMPPDSDGVGRQ